MFSTSGARSDRQNRILAGTLAFVGGFVNSCGFVLIGTYTSHVTGSVGRLGNDVAAGDYAAALTALAMVLSFFGGAFFVSVVVESHLLGHASRAYASALASEALLLVAFTLLSQSAGSGHGPSQGLRANVLCMAMGLQNALVTRLSGAVVRTTHLTGVVTDLGIESARWFRYARRAAAEATGVPFVLGGNVPERPLVPKVALLATIAASFLVGATLGALSGVRLREVSMLFAALLVGACSLYAVVKGKAHEAAVAQSRR